MNFSHVFEIRNFFEHAKFQKPGARKSILFEQKRRLKLSSRGEFHTRLFETNRFHHVLSGVQTVVIWFSGPQGGPALRVRGPKQPVEKVCSPLSRLLFFGITEMLEVNSCVFLIFTTRSRRSLCLRVLSAHSACACSRTLF